MSDTINFNCGCVGKKISYTTGELCVVNIETICDEHADVPIKTNRNLGLELLVAEIEDLNLRIETNGAIEAGVSYDASENSKKTVGDVHQFDLVVVSECGLPPIFRVTHYDEKLVTCKHCIESRP